MSRASLVLIVVALSTALGVAGCALFERRTAPQLTETAEKVADVAETSVAVLQCASFMQRMAFDSGKRLSSVAAVAFCTALEQSPDVQAPSAPDTSPAKVIAADTAQCT